MYQRRGRGRFSALSLVIELVSTVVVLWVFFVIELIRCPAFSDDPVTIFQYIQFLIQSIKIPA